MNTNELKEQLQQDLLSLLEGMGIEDTLSPSDYENLKNEVCDIVITNVNKLKQYERKRINEHE